MLKRYFRFIAYLIIVSGFSAANAGVYEDFFKAVNLDDERTVSALLQRGFDPNSRDERGQTPLYLSLRESAFRVTQRLLDQPQTRIDLPNAANETALMMAALRGHVDWAARLLDKGARIEGLTERDQPGWTPLHYAAASPSTATVELLLSRGAKLDALSPNRTTALMMAAQYGPESTVDLLLKQGADARLRNDLDLSAADFAQRAGRDALADRLKLIARP